MILEGARIILRKVRRSDVGAIYKYAKERDVQRYTLLPSPYTKKDAEDFVKRSQKRFRKKETYGFAIELKESKKLIGMISLNHVHPTNKSATLGYWLGKPFWGRGIMSEAVKLILEFGFTELKLVRIQVGALTPNAASLKIIEKFGFVYEGLLRKVHSRWGKWYDEKIYSLLREEFLGKRPSK